MSEEEIIKDLQKYVELIDKEYCDECNELNVISGKYCNGSRNVALAIQGLLDLYNKEKEKNKKIKDGILFVGRRNGKSAEQKIILDEYISKDKIREYLNKMEKRCNKPKFSVMKKEIEELLEERN